MKKIIAFVLSVALMVSAVSVLSGCSDEKAVPKTGEVLYVYNWGEYISNGDDGSLDTNAQFEKETGIEVKYLNFSSNEEMYAKMKSGGMTVDVIIPSDYMIAQLIRENMLEKLDYDNIPNYENIDEKFRKPAFDPTGEYSVAYTWGCTAIFYDSRYVDEADIDENTWDLLWNEKYSGKILMFNNQRDAFGIAEAKLGYSLNSENQEELDACYEELVKQCPLVQGYYGDQIFEYQGLHSQGSQYIHRLDVHSHLLPEQECCGEIYQLHVPRGRRPCQCRVYRIRFSHFRCQGRA